MEASTLISCSGSRSGAPRGEIRSTGTETGPRHRNAQPGESGVQLLIQGDSTGTFPTSSTASPPASAPAHPPEMTIPSTKTDANGISRTTGPADQGDPARRDQLFRILGPLEVCGKALTGSPVRRAILTAILLRPGQSIGVAEFSEILWGDPPLSATANIRSHITGLRRDLEEVKPELSRRLRTHRGFQSGYGLEIAPEECDLPGFTSAVRRGRNCLLHGDLDSAVSSLEGAVAMWRGPFGQDLPPTWWFDAHTAGLNDALFDAYQDLFTACILAGRTAMLTYRIESAITEAPYRQRLWELLAAVHCVNGDAASALSVVKRCEGRFAEDLGLDLPPGVEAMRAAALDWDHDEALRLVAAHVVCSTGRTRHPSAPLRLSPS